MTAQARDQIIEGKQTQLTQPQKLGCMSVARAWIKTEAHCDWYLTHFRASFHTPLFFIYRKCANTDALHTIWVNRWFIEIRTTGLINAAFSIFQLNFIILILSHWLSFGLFNVSSRSIDFQISLMLMYLTIFIARLKKKLKNLKKSMKKKEGASCVKKKSKKCVPRSLTSFLRKKVHLQVSKKWIKINFFIQKKKVAQRHLV